MQTFKSADGKTNARHVAIGSVPTSVELLENRVLLTGGADYADRGWVSIIVDHTIAVAVGPKLERLKQELIGDGYKISPDSMDHGRRLHVRRAVRTRSFPA
jgi:hypothetical protein